VSSAGLGWTIGGVELVDPATAWSTLRDPHAGDAARGRAEALRSENDHRLAEVFGRCDLLFTPTTPRLPHGHDDPGPHMNVALTWAFNLSGHPAISVPAGATSTGIPVGLQVVARPGADRALLDLATQMPAVDPAPPATAPTPDAEEPL